MGGILHFGGTFNPVHIGHLRLAIEAREACGFDRVVFLPCNQPFHKTGGLASFATRVELLRAAVKDSDGLSVDDLEGRLPVPSFTIRTFEALAEREPRAERHFMLGHEEFVRLHRWHRGRDLVALTHVVVAARLGFDAAAFCDLVAEAWPGSVSLDPERGEIVRHEILPGRHVRVISPPRIDLSASLVRDRWLAGRNVDHLVPAAVLRLMREAQQEIDAAWRGAAQALKPLDLEGEA